MTLVEKIADAVLYEGYILYPYRPSAVKNQQRWNFGALCPPAYAEVQGGSERSTMQTECLIQSEGNPTLDVRLRFLQLIDRQVGELVADCSLAIAECGHIQSGSERHFRLVPRLEVNKTVLQSWQEAVERDVYLPAIEVGDLISQSQRLQFTFTANNQVEDLFDQSTGQVAGMILRTQQVIDAEVTVTATRLSHGLFKVNVGINNVTPLDGAVNQTRDQALMRSLVSTHTILGVQEGGFVSLLDPPEEFKAAASACSNIGTYPILVGEEGARDCMLSSPIILYDYPQIAPESAGNLFDGTEIDEILTLRIMTLTEEEKREMRGADELARKILERTQKLPPEQLMKMHGTMRSK